MKVAKLALGAVGTGIGLAGLAALAGAVTVRDLVNRYANNR